MESVVRLQDRLVVGVSREEGTDGTRISFTYTDKSPRTAVGWVNALANSFADGYRQEWRGRVEQAYRDAEEAAGRAAEELREATSRLNAAGGPQLQESHRAAAKPTTAPPLVGNPNWLDLQRQLAELRQRRTRLLVNRTPIHPEVQQTEFRIADLQRQLEATERFAPASSRTTASLPASNAQHATPQAEAAESLNRLAKAAQRASRANRDAAHARRQAEITRRQDLQIDSGIRPSRAVFAVAGRAFADGRGGLGRGTDDDDRRWHDRRRRGHRTDGQLPGRHPRLGDGPDRRRHSAKSPLGREAVGLGRRAPHSGSPPA